MPWLDRARCSDKMQLDLSNISITLMASITASRNLSSRDKQEVYWKKWPLRSLPAPGRYRTLYAAPSTRNKWSSRSGRQCEFFRPFLWKPWVIKIHFEKSRHAVFSISIFQQIMKHFSFVLLSASVGSHLQGKTLWVHFPIYFTTR